MNLRRWLASISLIVLVGTVFSGLWAWKSHAKKKAAEATAHIPERVESLRIAVVAEREFNRYSTTTGTVRALQSIVLKNELPGTVHSVSLVPGAIVEADTILVALDISVEEADLKAQEAQAALARSTLERMEKLSREKAVPELELDQARAQRDVALARIEGIRAVMARKTLRAPFRARVGLSDLHRGQYLEAGTELTTLQGVADAVHVDFQVTQETAGQLKVGDSVAIVAGVTAQQAAARIVALDSRVNENTRNIAVRARIDVADHAAALAPGAAVRVRVPVGSPEKAAAIPISALRRGADGDFVFVVAKDAKGKERASLRPIKVEALENEMVFVAQGLKFGERIAATGSFKLREGVLVAEAPEQPAVSDAGEH